MPDMQFSAGSVSLRVDAIRGGRLASLNVDGLELLVVGPSDDGMQWGSYPMVPWAGRIREGLFSYGGITHQLPLNLGPHAIHGVGFTSEWFAIDDSTIGLDMGSPWPYGGRVTQHFALTESELTITMNVTAEVDMPVMVGWHPWFARHLDVGAGPVEAELSFGPAMMYELDDAAIPTGELVTPSPGPWDNCFTSLQRTPTIRWPGLLELDLRSSCDHWVIYTEPSHALCVEPQSEAPDVFNRDPPIVEAGQDYEAWFRLAWH